MSGEKSLHEWLKRNRLLYNPNSCWRALTKADLHKEFPPLHTAILRGDKATIQKHLENGSDLNESDANGRTPLHLSILQKNKDLFQFLIKKVDIKLYDGQAQTPLHVAARTDLEGDYVQALIDAGADVNSKGPSLFGRLTPIDLAIKTANLRAIDVLLKAGAKCSEKNIQDLEKLSVTTGRALLPKSRL
jgi:ankyrin repeat protein